MENKYKPKSIFSLIGSQKESGNHPSEPFKQEPFSDSEIDKALMNMRADGFDIFFAEKKL